MLFHGFNIEPPTEKLREIYKTKGTICTYLNCKICPMSYRKLELELGGGCCLPAVLFGGPSYEGYSQKKKDLMKEYFEYKIYYQEEMET